MGAWRAPRDGGYHPTESAPEPTTPPRGSAGTSIRRETIEEALENDRCGICSSVEHFREDHLREEIAQATFKAVVEREESWVAGQPAPPWERQTEYVHNLYRVIADAALATDGIQRLINGVAAVREEIEEEERYHAELPAWEISVLVSTKVPRETREVVFEAVVDAACDAMGEGHDDCPFVAGHPTHQTVPLHILRRALGDER